MALAALGMLALASPAVALEQTLLQGDGAAGDLLGSAVAIDGDTAVVGAPGDDRGSNPIGKGAVYVFQRVGDTWTNTAKLIASDGSSGVGGFPGDGLGSSVAIEGDTIVAGAPNDSFPSPTFTDQQGSVYTFARTGPAVRFETAKLTASDGATSDGLGASVDIDGDTIVAGALGAGSSRGAVYTFARTGGNRTEMAKLTATDGGVGDGLGDSVAIDGDTIVAGAFGDNVGGTDRGSVYTFARTGANPRSETAKLTASDGADFDNLGSTVAIAGDSIAAGAPNDDVGANVDQGSVYTFARTGVNPRSETAKLTASDGAGAGGGPDGGDGLGNSVAIAGDAIVAGAPNDNVGANVDQGSVYTFARTGANPRNETGKMTASDGAAEDIFGVKVAIAGDTIVAGAPFDNVGANADQGSATVFFASAAPLPPGGGVGATAAAPSNAFSVGGLSGKTLKLNVNSFGTAEVTDAGAQSTGTRASAAANRMLKSSSASGGPGIIEVTLKLTKAAKQKLRQTGQVKVNARITFTPRGGAPNSQTQRLKIKKR